MDGADRTVVPTNEFQTPITESFLASMSEWSRDRFMDAIDNIPLAKWMISPNRPRAKDLPRDGDGRITVDITRPHILDDIDYFRPAARFFEENGRYTFLKPNANPNSEFGKWYLEERRRCWEGYVRPEDGEWVTGYMYWFLNYCPIMKTLATEAASGIRVSGFPEFWEGIYYRFHYLDQARKAGKHCIELSRRGSGKSFTFASMLSHNLSIGENKVARARGSTILLAKSKEFLLDSKDGTLGKFTPMMSFLSDNTKFPTSMLKESPSEMTWVAGYKDKAGMTHGTRNSVMAVSIQDDESKIRGKRGIFLFEEMGSFPSLLSTYDNLRDAVKDGEVVFGQIYLLGTAGDSESDFSGARTILYNPDRYDIYKLENVYDRAGDGGKAFGYFFPSYVSRTGCIGRDGNSDVVKALRSIIEERDSLRGGDSSTFLKRVAEMPVTPAEAILRVKSSWFDVALINERLRQMESDPRAYDDEWVGSLVETPGGVEFRPTDDKPIRNWPLKDNADPGALVIWEMPQNGSEGRPVTSRYIIGCDPYDNDQAESDSLFSVFVFDLFTDRLVAEFTGRKPFAEDCYEVVYMLCVFYNALCMYESNRKMMFSYFSKRRALWMLADCPEYLKDRQLVKYSMFGSSIKGISVNGPINSFAIDLIKDWIKKTYVIEVDENGTKVTRNVPNIFAVRSHALLQELAGYDPGRNTDRVSALAQVMLYREQFMILYGGSPERDGAGTEDAGEDEFFGREWGRQLERLRRRRW